jgi:hypothetical protein
MEKHKAMMKEKASESKKKNQPENWFFNLIISPINFMPCTQTVTGHFHFTDLAYLVAEERSLDDQLVSPTWFLNMLFTPDFSAQKIPITTFSVTGI